ncbi:helix-turn-helix transcriptional regulator [Corynebacterium sp.]|uniref:helix-turn-helix transcriptional regulator n=1 Tax=Corynebacterium sp. TaxID=1720 RepID=UPI0026DF0B44|nr:helix-turn-helix transcriptional regulator [Corynebacterium sp.]MDO5511884.1 helix-turn-helix transcriptional regulator [Corynebacterium sp.]
MNPDDIGTAARIRRQELGLRQWELADLAGVSERLIREIERGKPGLRLDTLLRVLDVLGYQVTLSQFDALSAGPRP